MSFARDFKRYALVALGVVAMLLAASPLHADTAVSSCGTLSAAGNYFLTKNLTSAGTCIVIGSEGVSLDMRGRTITGNGTGDGISDGGGGGIVAAGNGCCTTLFNSIVSGNGGTGLFMEGCCSFLISSLVSGNSGDGVDMNDCCNSVVNSGVSLNTGKGISLIESDNLVSNTDVSSNGGDGIFLAGVSNQIASSKATSNGGFGANVGCPGAITGLKAKNNASGGLNTSGGTCTQVNNEIK